MEEEQHNLEVSENQLGLKKILVNKPDEDELASSSKDDKTKQNKEPTEPVEKEEKTEAKASSPSRSSPEPSCAICLEQLQNKSFTDSCFHMFCFTCLLEWSKVKPECPLCKQSFKSIVHNVRSNEEYDQYYIKSQTSEFACYNERRFRYRTTMVREGQRSERMQMYADNIRNQIASHRMRFAPHSVRIITSLSSINNLPCSFRRRIYEQDLWATPVSTDRICVITPEFYRNNIACTHRLIPWLNRELVALLESNSDQVSFVMELIMALITRYHITSQEFFLHIDPYIAPRTSHFIHEFHNFAISPYAMASYDRRVEYVSHNQTFNVSDSPDSDVIPIVSETRTTRTSKESKKKDSSKKKRKRLKKLILKRNCANNSWETVTPSVPGSQYDISPDNLFEIPGPSTSRQSEFPRFSVEGSNEEIEKSDDIECLHDDECQILEVLKPKSERTPELINLSSDDEIEAIDQVTLSGDENTQSEDNTKNTVTNNLNNTFSSNAITSIRRDTVLNTILTYSVPSDSDDDLLLLLDEEPIDYSMNVPKTSSITVDSNNNSNVNEDPGPSSVIETVKFEKPLEKSLLDHIEESPVCIENFSEQSEPSAKKLKFETTDHKSDNLDKTVVSKLKKEGKKLKSVIGNYTYCSSSEKNDSISHSVHKKHKEKKKKKKKHSHKHKHRTCSSESN